MIWDVTAGRAGTPMEEVVVIVDHPGMILDPGMFIYLFISRIQSFPCQKMFKKKKKKKVLRSLILVSVVSCVKFDVPVLTLIYRHIGIAQTELCI